MSLKIKIPIIIIILLIFNTIALYLYIDYYFFQELAQKLEVLTGFQISKATLSNSKIGRELIHFELIILIFMIILLGVIIFVMYSKPLAKLNRSVKLYKSHAIERTKRKDEIGQLQNSFALLSAELMEEKQAQNRMIASISHDIKTPLTSVLGYSENLIKKDLPEERIKQYLKVIHSRAKDIEAILLDFDGYIEGKLSTELQLQTYPIAYIEEILCMEYQNEIIASGIDFQVVNHCNSSEKLQVDLAKLRRVFANLIGNAMKHNKEKKNLSIRVDISKKHGAVTFVIADNGKGIDAKDFPHIFEPFYTSDQSRAVSGLGLSICQNIIRAHSGEIWAENNEYGGLSICFTIALS